MKYKPEPYFINLILGFGLIQSFRLIGYRLEGKEKIHKFLQIPKSELISKDYSYEMVINAIPADPYV